MEVKGLPWEGGRSGQEVTELGLELGGGLGLIFERTLE